MQQTKDSFKDQPKKGNYISVFSSTCINAGFAMNSNVILTLIFIDDEIVTMSPRKAISDLLTHTNISASCKKQF